MHYYYITHSILQICHQDTKTQKNHTPIIMWNFATWCFRGKNIIKPPPKTLHMRRIFCLLAVLTIFNGLAGAQKLYLGGSSNVTLFIQDTADQIFLDKVETKLLHAISLIQRGKNNTLLNAYYTNPFDGTDWRFRYTPQEIESDTVLNTDKEAATYYQYELVVEWDSTLNTGNILGFSKKYYRPLNKWDNNLGKEICVGMYNMAKWHIPLAQYRFFLTQKEMEKIYQIIQKCFIRSLNNDGAFWNSNKDTTSLSFQTLVFNKTTDSLIQMPLSLWARFFRDWTLNGEVSCYNSPWCKTNRLTYVESRNVFNNYDTVLDENGNTIVVNSDCYANSITIAEHWKFDTIKYNSEQGFYPYALKVRREIISIGANISCEDKKTRTTWLPYSELNLQSTLSVTRIITTQLDNALFNKLTLKFHYPGY